MKSYLERLLAYMRAEPHKDPRLSPPLASSKRVGVPTLSPGQFRPESEMVRERFDFCDKWEDAPMQALWLGLREMKEVWQPDHPARDAIRIRRETWPDSLLSKTEDSRVTLFGLDEDLFEQVFLIWPEIENSEPQVLAFHTNYERIFADLSAYMQWLCKLYESR